MVQKKGQLSPPRLGDCYYTLTPPSYIYNNGVIITKHIISPRIPPELSGPCKVLWESRPSQLNMAQTPQQRRANERYARQEAAKRGKPESAIKQKQKFSSSISPIWIGVLVFVLCGGIIFELLRLFF